MNDINKLFFELIRVAIGNAVCLSHTPTNAEWMQLYELAKKQSLVGICFAGVQRLQGQKQSPPEMLYLQWMGMAAKIQQRNEVLNRQCAELVESLKLKGYRSCILKGQGIASLYKVRAERLELRDSDSESDKNSKLASLSSHLGLLRQSGDIDIWIEGGLDKALAWAKSQGVVEKLNDHHFDLKLCDDSSKSTAKDIAIEVHYKPGTLLRRNKDKEYQKWIEQNASAQFDNTVTLSNGSVINAPTDAFNLIYMQAHMHRHLFSEGLGLRQLMDYYFLLQHALIDNSDWVEVCIVREIVRQESAKLGLDKFASGILWVLGQVFGLSMIQMPWTPNQMVGEFLLEEIMRGGNFGHHDETYRLTQGASHGRRLMEKAVNVLRFVKLFPKECVWSTLDYVDSFFYRYKQSKLKTT